MNNLSAGQSSVGQEGSIQGLTSKEMFVHRQEAEVPPSLLFQREHLVLCLFESLGVVMLAATVKLELELFDSLPDFYAPS